MEKPIEFLERLSDFGIKLGLDKTLYLLKKFGNPHLKYPSILIGGTNGKGSVAKVLSEILYHSGYKVGLYTSPHLLKINERICVNNKPISDKKLNFYIKKLKKIISDLPYHNYPTFFEALTVIGFLYFFEEKVDILVAEVGMGGRFDATNVLPSFLEIMTPISLDHTNYLGRTLNEIALQKAGIIKSGSCVISGRQKKVCENIIMEKVREKKAKIYTYLKDFRAKRVYQSVSCQIFNFYGNEKYKGLKTKLLGRHQIQNISLAIQASCIIKENGFRIKDESIYKGVENTYWPARFQILKENPIIIVDGAHNPEGIEILKKTISEVFPGEKFSFLVGIMKDKDWRNMLKKIFNIADEIIFTRIDSERAIEPEILADFSKRRKGIKIEIIKRVDEALKEIEKRKKNLCICGSLYLAGEVLKIFKRERRIL